MKNKEFIINSMFEIAKLSDDEYQAVYDYIDSKKDSFKEPFKSGILKLLNNECKNRM